MLFWEEIGGLASHLWGFLQVMRHGGILDRISGMVVGVPRDIAGLEASPTLAEIVLDVLGRRDIPVLGNVEFGHAGANLPMPVGIRAGLDAGGGPCRCSSRRLRSRASSSATAGSA